MSRDYSHDFKLRNSDANIKIYNKCSYKDPLRDDSYCYTNPKELYATMFRDKYNK